MDTENILLYGNSEPFPEPTILKSGNLIMHYCNGFIRQIRYGDHEILRMIYFAIRDHNWKTIPGKISNEHINTSTDSFSITYDIRFHTANIDYLIQSTIEGNSDGKIRFHILGKALSTFSKNRLGICVLHPQDCAGKSCKVEHWNNDVSNGTFPEYISPHQPFKDIKSIRWFIDDQCDANIEFSGEVFEMEDQRNWTDASFKTYCTPLDHPFPADISKGDHLEQEIRFELLGQPLDPIENKSDLPSIDWQDQYKKLPALGLGDTKTLLTEKEAALISALNLSHLRIELDLTSQNWYDTMENGLENASNILLNVELVLLFGPEPDSELLEFKGAYIWNKATVIAISVIRKADHVTDQGLLTVITELQEMFPDVKVGGGSSAYFTELNRNLPDMLSLEFLTYSITPQVHAYDNLSLIENLEGQPDTVLSARRLGNDLSIHVSPVTLLPRFNPDATGTKALSSDESLPSGVDSRQPSLFNMVWTLGSIKQIASARADLITYFEAKGWGGIINGDEPLNFPEKAGSKKGEVFPVYAVFHMIGNFRDSGFIRAISGDSLKYEVFVLTDGNRYRIFLSNLTMNTITLSIDLPRSEGKILKIDISNVKDLMAEPIRFLKKAWLNEEFTDEYYHPVLEPYSTMVIDL